MTSTRKSSLKIILKRNWKLSLAASVFSLWAVTLPQTLYGMELSDEKRPHEHFCPITLEVMKDPVVASDGRSYERKAIEEYFQKNPQPKSPLTGLPLLDKNLVNNQALKSMIHDWRPDIPSGPSALDGRSAADIAQRVRKEFKHNEALLDSAKGRHIVAFLGNTGAGKSTLVNLLAGKKIKVSDDGEDYVLVDPNDPSAMVIGTTGNSETLYPKSIDIDGLRFFDLPGFNDTDGSERNLVNAAFARKILMDAASVRLVFVVGQDQFTADRSASVRQMFNSLKNLFVLEQSADLVDNGVFVATKVTCTPQADMTEFLLKKTASTDKADLNSQLQSWSSKNKLCRMFHPLRESSNEGVREQILELISQAKGAKVRGINVSALYPSDTQQDLERVFLNVLEEAFVGKLKDQPQTLTAYNHTLEYFLSKDFWSTFSASVCEEDSAVGLLKDFCGIPYTKALTTLEQQNAQKLRQHIQNLEGMFVSVLEETLKQKWKNHPVTLIEFNQVLEHYTSNDFWQLFSEEVCGEEKKHGLLDEGSPYTKALSTLEQQNREGLKKHIQTLEGMFVSVLEKALTEKQEEKLVTVTNYNQALEHYTSKDFWQMFSSDVCSKNKADEFLKEAAPYTKALATLKQENQEKLRQHIQHLEQQKQKRIQDIEKRTEQRTKEVISRLVPSKAGDDFVAFDFAYHRDFHDQVCGGQAIGQLATDPLEQEIVRSCYAGVISQHSHHQMMDWFQKFSGVASLKEQLEITQKKLYELVEEPIIKAQEAEEEKRRAIEARKSAERAKRIEEEHRAREASEAVEQAKRAEENRIAQLRVTLNIPKIAYGYEDIYQRFLNGRLIYKPYKDNDNGKIELCIRDLANPLEGTFDLSKCGDTGNYLSISTGYRKGKKPENAYKVEIWFAPKFLIGGELNTTARHFQGIYNNWSDNAPVGIFWTWAGCDNLDWYDYLTTENVDNLSKMDLYENYKKHRSNMTGALDTWCTRSGDFMFCL